MRPEGKIFEFRQKGTSQQPAEVVGLAVPREGTNVTDLITDYLPGVQVSIREHKIVITRLVNGHNYIKVRHFRETTPCVYVWMSTEGKRTLMILLPKAPSEIQPFQDPA